MRGIGTHYVECGDDGLHNLFCREHLRVGQEGRNAGVHGVHSRRERADLVREGVDGV